MDGITMDGIFYDVRVKYDTLDRAFRLTEGVNAGDMLSGRHERDLVGTYYDYALQVEPNPKNRAAYDAFYQAISAPQDTHSITLPYGQGELTFQGHVASVQDALERYDGSAPVWGALRIEIVPVAPQRRPE